MAGSDDLAELLDIARRALPDVPESEWSRIENRIRLDFGTQRIYIAARRKKSHLDALAEAGEDADAQQLAQRLGVSVRRIQQLRRLRAAR